MGFAKKKLMISPETQLRRVQWLMLPVGALGILAWWVSRSGSAAGAFGLGALASWGLWLLHVLLVKRMLTPGNPGRAGYVFLSIGKLALIGLALAGIMERYPEEGIPFATGLMLSVGAILFEAVLIAFSKVEPVPLDPPDGPSHD